MSTQLERLRDLVYEGRFVEAFSLVQGPVGAAYIARHHSSKDWGWTCSYGGYYDWCSSDGEASGLGCGFGSGFGEREQPKSARGHGEGTRDAWWERW